MSKDIEPTDQAEQEQTLPDTDLSALAEIDHGSTIAGSDELIAAKLASVPDLSRRTKKSRHSLNNQKSGTPGVGRSFGNYTIEEEISRGSFGVVYKARQQGLDRIVALKVLLAGSHASEEAVARFQREAKSVARLKHPNIVPIYDIGQFDNHHYFAMEFIRGHSLAQLIEKKEVTISQAMAFTEALADGIYSAHWAGVIHRDIKPSNILIDADGKPHITDFGLAKQVDLDTKYTQSGTTLGTPAYMPPEQARGEIDKVNERSDVYAIGAVLYEMLTGQPPFAGRSLLEVVVAVINEPVRPPRTINPHIHRDIQTIVLKCLEKDPINRYASAAELRDDIRRFRNGESIMARPVGLVRKTSRLFYRYRYVVLAAILVMAALGVALNQMRVNRELARQIKDIDKVKTQQELQAEKDEIPEWKPFWWWPRSIVNEPIKPNEVPYFEKGFVTFNKGRVPDLDAQRQRTITLPPEQALVSPAEKSIFGDLNAELRFTLNEQAAAQELRIGFQAYNNSIPILLAIVSNRLAVIVPEELYTTFNQPVFHPRLRVKAETRGPKLVEGEYHLQILREGLNLRFDLTGPAGSGSVAIWDMGLTHWLFSNVQLTVRQPPQGFTLNSAYVQFLSSPKRTDNLFTALRLLYNGQYNGARTELNAIADDRTRLQRLERKDRLKVARALYHLALLREIHNDYDRDLMTLYDSALDALAQSGHSRERWQLEGQVRLRRIGVAFKNLKEYMNEKRTPENHFQIECDIQALAETIQDELRELRNIESEMATIKPVKAGLGQPFAWEFVDVIEEIVQSKSLGEPDKRKVKPAGPAPANLDPKLQSQLNQLALMFFQRLGLPVGSESLSNAASRLGVALAADNKVAELKSLYLAYPTSNLQTAFMKLIHRDIGMGDSRAAMENFEYTLQQFSSAKAKVHLEEAAALLIDLCFRNLDFETAGRLIERMPQAAVVETMSQRMRDMTRNNAWVEHASALFGVLKKIQSIQEIPLKTWERIDETVGLMGKQFVIAEQFSLLQQLHTLRPTPRLQDAFASAIVSLAEKPSSTSDKAAIEILEYTQKKIEDRDKKIARAVFHFANKRTILDERESYNLLLDLQRLYPSSEHLPLIKNVLSKLLEGGLPERALRFYLQVRGVFPRDGAALNPFAISALEALSPEQRLEHLGAMKSKLVRTLDQLPEAGQLWRLELGDILLHLVNTEDEILDVQDIYGSLSGMERLEPALKAQVLLRLGALLGTQDRTFAFMAQLTGEKYPDEVRLAGRLFAEQGLELEQWEMALKQSGAPAVYSQAEWTMLRSLHEMQQNRYESARALLIGLAAKETPKPQWTSGLARYFLQNIAALKIPEPEKSDKIE